MNIKDKKRLVYSRVVVIPHLALADIGKQHYLWRAVDQDEEVVDVCLQTKVNFPVPLSGPKMASSVTGPEFLTIRPVPIRRRYLVPL